MYGPSQNPAAEAAWHFFSQAHRGPLTHSTRAPGVNGRPHQESVIPFGKFPPLVDPCETLPAATTARRSSWRDVSALRSVSVPETPRISTDPLSPIALREDPGPRGHRQICFQCRWETTIPPISVETPGTLAMWSAAASCRDVREPDQPSPAPI